MADRLAKTKIGKATATTHFRNDVRHLDAFANMEAYELKRTANTDVDISSQVR